MKTILITLAILMLFTTAQAKTLYARCQGRTVFFDFTGKGSFGSITIETGVLAFSNHSITLAPTDGLTANTASSFRLGSSVYSGTLEISKSGRLIVIDPRGVKATAICDTNLFDGEVVESSAEGAVAARECAY